MIIKDLLLELGFAPLPNRPQRYGYKGWTGRLDGDTFFFDGLSVGVTDPADLHYLIMLIDDNYHAASTPYPFNEN